MTTTTTTTEWRSHISILQLYELGTERCVRVMSMSICAFYYYTNNLKFVGEKKYDKAKSEIVFGPGGDA